MSARRRRRGDLSLDDIIRSTRGWIATIAIQETSGSIAIVDSLGGVAANGTHTSVTLGQQGIGNIRYLPFYDGINDLTSPHSAGLASLFNGAEFTAMAFVRVPASVWTDATNRAIMRLNADPNNDIFLNRGVGNGSIRFLATAGGITDQIIHTTTSPTDVFHVAMTRSESAGASGELKAYIDAVQVGTTQTTLGTWAGTLVANNTQIGSIINTGAWFWSDSIAYVALFNVALAIPEINNIKVGGIG